MPPYHAPGARVPSGGHRAHSVGDSPERPQRPLCLAAARRVPRPCAHGNATRRRTRTTPRPALARTAYPRLDCAHRHDGTHPGGALLASLWPDANCDPHAGLVVVRHGGPTARCTHSVRLFCCSRGDRALGPAPHARPSRLRARRLSDCGGLRCVCSCEYEHGRARGGGWQSWRCHSCQVATDGLRIRTCGPAAHGALAHDAEGTVLASSRTGLNVFIFFPFCVTAVFPRTSKRSESWSRFLAGFLVYFLK